jgi:radical SAM protein with 4Fe4S-binding SPASM domain
MKSCPYRIYDAEFSSQEINDAVRDGRLLSIEIEFDQGCNFKCVECSALDSAKSSLKLTIDEFIDVIKQAGDLGARKIIIIIIGGEPILCPDIMEYIRTVDMEIELFSNGTNITPGVSSIICQQNIDELPLVGRGCLRHQFSCTVNSEGNVQSCVGVTIPIGNVKKQSLKEILHDSEIVQDLKNFKVMIKAPCGECELLNTCYGCRGTAYKLTGDYLASDPLCSKNIDRRADIMFLPVNVARFIPHKPPMLLIDRILEVKERASVSEMIVRADMIFVDENGHLDDASYPEIISQAVAAQEGFRRFGGRNPLIEGFLLGIKNLVILGNSFVGDTLRISLYKKEKFGDFGILSGEVYKGDELIARGEIKVWQSDTGVLK